MIIVGGHVRVAADNRSTFLKGSAEAVRLAREEPGCLDFSVSPDIVDMERVNVYERWQCRSALLSFRGEGPGNDLNSLIIGADVREFEVQLVDESAVP
jgi:hypothetical protein